MSVNSLVSILHPLWAVTSTEATVITLSADAVKPKGRCTRSQETLAIAFITTCVSYMCRNLIRDNNIWYTTQNSDNLLSDVRPIRGGGGGFPYITDGDAHRNFQKKLLKVTILGVAPANFIT